MFPIYIDESVFQHNSPRLYGYSLKGTRCYARIDLLAKSKTNVIGALLGKRLLTLSLFKSNIDRQTFKTWLEVDLSPKLPDKSVLVLDNAAFHKHKTIADLVTLLVIF